MAKEKKATKKDADNKATLKKVTVKKEAAKKSGAKVKKAAVKKIAVKKSSESPPPSRSSRGIGVPCICVKKGKYWYCMKQLPDSSLMQCDGPFRSEAICQTHRCI